MKESEFDTDSDTIIDKAESLDDGVGNQVSASEAKDAVTKAHTQGSDSYAASDISNDSEAVGITIKDALNQVKLDIDTKSGKNIVTVGTSGADYNNFDDAIDYLREIDGGTIIVITDITLNCSSDKDVSNITFNGSHGGLYITVYPGTITGKWYGVNVTFNRLSFMWIMASTHILEVRSTTDIFYFNECIILGASGKEFIDAKSSACYMYVKWSILDSIAKNEGAATVNLTYNAYYKSVGGIGAIVYDSSTSFVGVASATQVMDTASKITNDSSVAGSTVKDALNSLLGDTKRIITFNLPSTSIGNGEQIQIHRFTVPTGKVVKVWAAGLSSADGAKVSGAMIRIWNESYDESEYYTNETIITGEPLATLSVSEDDISIKVHNESGLSGDFNGFISISVETA